MTLTAAPETETLTASRQPLGAPAEPVPVQVGEASLTIHDVVRVAAGAPVVFAPAARDPIKASEAALQQQVASGNDVYGVRNGLGEFCDQRADHPNRPLEIILGRNAGIGRELPAPRVQAAMLFRLATIAKGRSGVSLATAELLLGAINAGVVPVARDHDSVGAGDLTVMAAISARRCSATGERP